MADDSDKPGMGLTGATAGVISAGVGAGGTAVLSNSMGKRKLSDEARKFVNEGIEKAKKDFLENNPKPEEVSKDLKGDELKKAKDQYKKDLDVWEKQEAKHLKTAKQEELYKIKGAEEKTASAKTEFAKNNTRPAAGSAEDISKWEKDLAEKLKGLEGKEQDAAKEAFKKANPHPGEKAKEALNKWRAEEEAFVTKTLNKEVEGARAFNKAVAVEEASMLKKPIAAFRGMSGGGKAGAVAVGAVLALGAASLIKGGRQNKWQDRMDSERSSSTEEPAR